MTKTYLESERDILMSAWDGTDSIKVSGTAVGGSVAVTAVVPGVAATNLGKAEDAAHTSGDTGVEVLAVRQDTLSVLAANGDYIPLVVDASGRLWASVNAISGSLLPRGAIASGAIAAGSVAAGAVVSGAILSGALATGAIVDLPVKGQAAMAASVPVTMANDQSTLPTKGVGFSVQVDLTVDAGAYSIGDSLGAAMTFALMVSANGKHSIINSITLAPNDAMPAIPFNLWLLNADLVTPIAKNAAFTFVAADAVKILGIVPITAADYIASQNSWNVANLRGVGLEYKAGVATTSIIAYLVCTAVTAPVATHVYLTLTGEFID